VLKNFRSQGGGSLSSADKGREFFRCDRTFWYKNSDFFEVYGVGAMSQCGYFADNGEGSIFRGFVRTSIMDGPKSLVFEEKKTRSINRVILTKAELKSN